MFARPMLFCGVLLASVGVPYLLLDDHLAGTARDQWDRALSFIRPGADEDDAHSAAALPASALRPSAGATIEQAFRFDLTPQWVASRWSRVSTVLGEPEHLGMRVAWVSGTRPDDVAGSLTYYFDPHHQLARITFEGLTHDPRRLLAAVVPAFKLKSQPTTEMAHYTSGDPADPTSEVLVSHLPVLTADADAPRAEIFVDLSRGDALVEPRKAGRNPQAAHDSDVKLLPSTYRRW